MRCDDVTCKPIILVRTLLKANQHQSTNKAPNEPVLQTKNDKVRRQLYRLDSFLASSTAACNLSLAVRIVESDDELEGSTSVDGATGIGVTSGVVTKSGVTKGVEI